MRRNSVTRSPSEKSTASTFTSVSSGLATSIDANTTTATRRNSWHRQRGESISIGQVLDSPTQIHPRHDLGMSDLAGIPRTSTTYDSPFVVPANQQTSSRTLHRSYESQHSLDSVQSVASVTPTDGDDQVHLTSAPSGSPLRGKGDPESRPSSSPRRLNRPPGHYGETSAPRRTMGTLKSVSRNIRRMSVRVVNLAGVTLEDRPIRLEDDPAEQQDEPATPVEMMPEPPMERLRGRTLGIFGPTSGIRRSMLSVLLWRYALWRSWLGPG